MANDHRNISFATVQSFADVLNEGTSVEVRGQVTLEIRNRVTCIKRPQERCVFLPGRGNDVFAQIAETLWVLSGRDDLQWLTAYVPRAPDFSDDLGRTWRGAYGPRIRAWQGVDQLAKWRELLTNDPQSRRVVGVLFDPARDLTEQSKDVPCNNWLSWLLRDGRLHLNVAIRSNDAMWGFSGINAFEWSVFQEIVAYWLNVEVGDATFFATSYHLYDRHFKRAKDIVRRFYGVSPYDFRISPPPFQTRWENFDSVLSNWFEIEGRLRIDQSPIDANQPAMKDPFLAATLSLIRIKWGIGNWTDQELKDELAALPLNDFTVAAYEFFARDRPQLLRDIPQKEIAAFFEACFEARTLPRQDLISAIKSLHARKNHSYAGSWKRRGETVSVLPNVARKVDRLSAFVESGSILQGETVLDTAIDLYVYLLKYRLLSAERLGNELIGLPNESPQPLSDHDSNFNKSVDLFPPDFDAKDSRMLIHEIIHEFEELLARAQANDSEDRLRRVSLLSELAAKLVGALATSDPGAVAKLVRDEKELQR